MVHRVVDENIASLKGFETNSALSPLPSQLVDDDNDTAVRPPLPLEILSRIISFLLPKVDRYASTWPNPHNVSLDTFPAPPESATRDVHAALSASSLFYQVASEALYSTPLLWTLKALNLLARTISDDIKHQSTITRGHGSSRAGDDSLSQASSSARTFSRASWIRAVHLPPGDGLLQPGDTLADQTHYIDSLRMLFDHAARISYLSLEHRQAGAALLELLHPRTVSRPTRLTLSNLSFSAPPFSATLDLAPLSRLTHLHLIKIVPPPAMISFLVGTKINDEDQGSVPNAIAEGLSPRATLSCLRLSLLPADALVEFGAYVAWRKAWSLYERLKSQDQAREPAPRAPLGPARRFAVQEALYDLATHSSSMPNLRLLLLELSPLEPLLSPCESDPEGANPFPSRHPSFLRAHAATGRARINGMNATGFTSSSTGVPVPLGMVMNVEEMEPRATRTDAYYILPTPSHPSWLPPPPSTMKIAAPPWMQDSILKAQSRGRDTEAYTSLEDLRTGERDEYWRLVEKGKYALLRLWNHGRSSPTPPPPTLNAVNVSSSFNELKDRGMNTTASLEEIPEMHTVIKVVAARPNGHDRKEGFVDFYCQSQHTHPAGVSTRTISAGSARGRPQFDPPLRYSHDTAPPGVGLDPGETAEEEEKAEYEMWEDGAGCWADNDIFDLVHLEPHLSYRSTPALPPQEVESSSATGAAEGQGGRSESAGRYWWWTGELPRATYHNRQVVVLPTLTPRSPS